MSKNKDVKMRLNLRLRRKLEDYRPEPTSARLGKHALVPFHVSQIWDEISFNSSLYIGW